MNKNFLAKYKILGKIGEGSFSDVIKVENRTSGMQYAAKRLKKNFRTTQDIVNCAEIKAMMKLTRHPNVLYMIEYIYEPSEGNLVFVFELMDMNMYEYMKIKKSLNETRVKFYLYQILKGLQHLHRSGLFHRDVKPENILIKFVNTDESLSSEVIKLADLGSIRSVFSNSPFTEYISTRWYRSPECLLTNGAYGPKMDVWATGCVFYEMLTLEPLFAGRNEVDQLSKIHAILGSPSRKILNKFQPNNKFSINFPKQNGMGIHALLPGISEDGRLILSLMIQYDPAVRPEVAQLLKHRYFQTLRGEEIYGRHREESSKNISTLMQAITSDKFYNKYVSEGSATTISRVEQERKHLKCKTSSDICKQEEPKKQRPRIYTKNSQTSQKPSMPILQRTTPYLQKITPYLEPLIKKSFRNIAQNDGAINLKRCLQRDIYEVDDSFSSRRSKNSYTRALDNMKGKNMEVRDFSRFRNRGMKENQFYSKSYVVPRMEPKVNSSRGVCNSFSSKNCVPFK